MGSLSARVRWLMPLVAAGVLLAAGLLLWLADLRDGADTRDAGPDGVGAQAGGTGGIAGQVIEADSGAGVAGATVRFVCGNAVDAAVADGEGRFRLEGLSPCAGRLEVEATGYLATGRDRTARVPVRVRARRVLDEVDIGLHRGCSVSGRVLVFDEPAAGARVGVLVLEAPGESGAFSLDAVGRSGADGSYRIGGLPPGRLRVFAEIEGHPLVESRDVFLRGGQAVDGVDVQLGAAAKVVGKVVDEQDQPLAGAEVSLAVEGRHGLERTRTDEVGAFRFERVQPGAFVVRAQLVGSAPARKVSGRVKADQVAEVVVVLRKVAGVAGRVESPSGAPVDKAAVYLVPEGRPVAEAKRGDTSASDGTFWLAGPFDADRLHLWAVHPDFGPSDPIEVALGGQDVVLTLTEGGKLTGRVVAAADGKPVGRYRVMIASYRAADPVRVPGGVWGSRTVRDPGGHFLFDRLSPGDYGIRVLASGYTSAHVNHLRVQAGRTTDAGTIDMQAGGSITGRVVEDTSGAPLAGARVRAMVFGGFQRAVHAGQDGRFVLADVPAERLSVETSRRGYLTEMVSGITPPPGGNSDIGTIRLTPDPADDRGGFRYAGMGAQLQVENGNLWVTKAFDDAPAAQAGLAEGTRILAVDGYPFSDLDLARAVELIRGQVGTAVTLDVLLPGESTPRTVRIERSRIRAR